MSIPADGRSDGWIYTQQVEVVYISLQTKALEKGMKLSFLYLAIGK